MSKPTKYTVLETEEFSDWIQELASTNGTHAGRINSNIKKMQFGLLADWKAVKDGGSLKELRLDFGPGYRLYFTFKDGEIILLLCGPQRGFLQQTGGEPPASIANSKCKMGFFTPAL